MSVSLPPLSNAAAAGAVGAIDQLCATRYVAAAIDVAEGGHGGSSGPDPGPGPDPDPDLGRDGDCDRDRDRDRGHGRGRGVKTGWALFDCYVVLSNLTHILPVPALTYANTAASGATGQWFAAASLRLANIRPPENLTHCVRGCVYGCGRGGSRSRDSGRCRGPGRAHCRDLFCACGRRACGRSGGDHGRGW